MAHIEATTLAELVKFAKDNNGPILVDFHATWCGPCKAIAPYLVEQCKARNVPLAKVDVDQSDELSGKYGIQAMPTFKVIGT